LTGAGRLALAGAWLAACQAPAAGKVQQQAGASTVVDVSPGVDASSGAAVAIAADATTPVDEISAAAACSAWAKPIPKGEVSDPAVTEASGLAASRKHPNVLWVHNDSGDSARIFALDHAGVRLATFQLAGADAVDWEDLAIGPGPTKGETYLHIGDIGDNSKNRKFVQVYRVAEPNELQLNGELTNVDKLQLTYPDGAHDAETLLVDPRQGDLYVVAKASSGTSPVFRVAAPWHAGEQRTLTQVAVLQFGTVPLAPSLLRMATAGDITAQGDAIALRTYDAAFWWPIAPQQSVADALAGPPCPLPLPGQLQGETLGWSVDGQGYWTLAEGEDVPLWWVSRQ
jgi:hypothetical protein